MKTSIMVIGIIEVDFSLVLPRKKERERKKKNKDHKVNRLNR